VTDGRLELRGIMDRLRLAPQMRREGEAEFDAGTPEERAELLACLRECADKLEEWHTLNRVWSRAAIGYLRPRLCPISLEARYARSRGRYGRHRGREGDDPAPVHAKRPGWPWGAEQYRETVGKTAGFDTRPIADRPPHNQAPICRAASRPSRRSRAPSPPKTGRRTA
jgi:hypothetical protein